jgi:hypothetical protein
MPKGPPTRLPIGIRGPGIVSQNERRMLLLILHLIAMLEYLLLPERALKEGKTFSHMASEMVEIGLFDLKEAGE